jgi:excisionase family DNA binding protein
MNSDPISVDIPTACRMSGLSRSFLYEVLAAGHVRSVRAGRRRLVLVDSLRSWLQSLSTGLLAQPVHGNKQVSVQRVKP